VRAHPAYRTTFEGMPQAQEPFRRTFSAGRRLHGLSRSGFGNVHLINGRLAIPAVMTDHGPVRNWKLENRLSIDQTALWAGTDAIVWGIGRSYHDSLANHGGLARVNQFSACL